MLSKSTLQHLRIPFSFYLFPVFAFAISALSVHPIWKICSVSIILHFFVYPASHAFNSFYDRDVESIGGMENPMPVTQELFWVALFFDVAALLLAAWVSLPFAGMVFVYGCVSKAYSHPLIRLKRRPILGWIIVSIFQGGWIYAAVQMGVGMHLGQISILKAGLASLLIAVSYPLTQVYQHREDARRGDLTLSRFLNIRGTFVFSGLGFLSFGIFFTMTLPRGIWLSFFLVLMPIFVYFVLWMKSCFRDIREANFKNTMRMNQVSTFCISVFFLALCLNSASANETRVEHAEGFIKDIEQKSPWFLFERSRTQDTTAEVWISKFEDPVNHLPWVEEEVRFAAPLHFLSYHYVQNQSHDEGWIELKKSKLEFRFIHGGKETRKERDVPDHVAVPAMIENIVRENWKMLLHGDTYSFNLAVPDRMDYYGFKVFLDHTGNSSEGLQYIFKLKPTSIFVAAAVNPVFLIYNSQGLPVRAVGRCPVFLMTRSGIEEREADVHYLLP